MNKIDKKHITLSYLLDNISILLEDSLEEIYGKYYNKIEKEKFDKIVSSDPTSSIAKLGKYSKWLLNLYKKEGDKLLEDLYKAKEYLKVYDKVKKKEGVNPDINSYKSLPDLFIDIEKYVEDSEEVKSATELKKEQKEKIKEQAEKIYEDDNWLIVSPKTHEASCLYGAGTQWCTASREETRYFEDYTEDGNLYILINKLKKDDKGRQKKYQFHFQRKDYADERNKQINVSVFFDTIVDNNFKTFLIKLAIKEKGLVALEGTKVSIAVDSVELSEGFSKRYRETVQEILDGNYVYYRDSVNSLSDFKEYLKYLEFGEKNESVIKDYIKKRYNEEIDEEEINDFLINKKDELFYFIFSLWVNYSEEEYQKEARKDILLVVEEKLGKYKLIDDHYHFTVDLYDYPTSVFYGDISESFSDFLDSYYQENSEPIFEYNGFDYTPEINEKEFIVTIEENIKDKVKEIFLDIEKRSGQLFFSGINENILYRIKELSGL
jgi:hypothetical protein